MPSSRRRSSGRRLSRGLSRLARRARWRVQARLGAALPTRFGESRATAIVASFGRMRNVAPIVRTLLRCGFVERVVVSNHAPWVRIEDWVRVRDPRLRLSNEPVRRGSGHRWSVARATAAEHFIVVDDDVFVRAPQLEALFGRLLDDPSVPHGLHGARRAPGGAGVPAGAPLRWTQVSRRETDVEVLHKVYLVARARVDEYFRLRAALAGRDPSLPALVDDFGDDLLISATGRGRPRVHDVGSYAECRTAQRSGVAVSSSERFSDARERILRELRGLAERAPAG